MNGWASIDNDSCKLSLSILIHYLHVVHCQIFVSCQKRVKMVYSEGVMYRTGWKWEIGECEWNGWMRVKS